MRKMIITVFVLMLLVQAHPFTYAASESFSDVPNDHWANGYINELRDLEITDGVGNNLFGLEQTITRAEFTAFMCKLMKWDISAVISGSFADNADASKWYFSYIETALKNGAITLESGNFLPEMPITREDMAVMIVRTLGYDTLGKSLGYLGSPFPDVSDNLGYITIAKDLGIISGISQYQFAPAQTATREQAAAMLIRMYRLSENKASARNGFYAISSASQMNAIQDLDSVCFGWSRLELEGGILSLNVSASNGNQYNIPQGYQSPFSLAAHKEKMLMVAVKDSDSTMVINDAAFMQQASEILSQAILSGVSSGSDLLSFDGIVIDFEGLKGTTSQKNFNAFLASMKEKLSASNKKIYVAVQPQRRPGISYYDGYDFKTIGEIADKVILMAHDYNAKSLAAADMANGVVMTPAAPLDEVYYAVKAICDPVTGVADRSKVLLQVSFASVQWKTASGKTINQTPYTPAYDAIVQRIQDGAKMEYDEVSQSPYITFYDSADQTNNVIWYEDSRSVNAKMKIANLFGLGGMSYWRLGTIPDFSSELYLNVLQQISKTSI